MLETEEEREILGDIEIEDEEWEVIMFGEVSLSQDEKRLLSRQPEFALYGKLEKINLLNEIEMGFAKVHWERMENGYKLPRNITTKEEREESRNRYKAGL